MSCRYADSDAAYVLGALDPDEQHSYRAHLTGCAPCRAAVDELAAMPGFLARLRPGADDAVAGSAAPDLLPRLTERILAKRRTARWRRTAAGVLIAAAAVAGTWVLTTPEGSEPPATVLTMSAEPGVPVEATLLVTGRGWGTSIDTRCRYDGASGAAQGPTYLLVAIDDDGTESVVSSWRQLAGREITVPGSTRLNLADIARLEVRTADGETILRTSP